MFYRIYHIAIEYLRTTYSSRMVLIFALAMPLVFTFVLGTVIGGYGDGESTRWPVAVVNEDAGELGDMLIARLDANPQLALARLDREAALAQVEQENVVSAIVIPADFSSTLTAGGNPTIALFPNAVDLRSAQAVEQSVCAATSAMSGVINAAETAVAVAQQFDLFADGAIDPAAYFADAVVRAQTLWSDSPPLVVHSQALTRLDNPDQLPGGFQQSSPGMLVTFALVFMLNGAIVLIIEREQGTLRRLLVMPMRKSAILTGKLLAVFVAGLAQAAVLILVGQFAFGVNWGQAPGALALLLLAFSFSLTSLGMLIAGIARTYAQANALANILMYSIAALGGAWWPIEITPAWMQRVAQFTPTYWAMQGFNDIVTRGLGVQAILPEAIMLLVFGVVYLSVGVWRFRYE
ncbi:MAG TPA: ABC transporter permease [Caldilineae bacterium]|nr:ABC transporter permease [Caldilineae bacterium]